GMATAPGGMATAPGGMATAPGGMATAPGGMATAPGGETAAASPAERQPGATPKPGTAAARTGGRSDAPVEDPLRSGPLLGRAGALSTDLRLDIDYPGDGDVVGDPEGAFVAGRALALLGEFRRFDVFLVIDTSDSTRASSGTDVNENGVVGEDRLFGVFPTSDAGDSVLAAEVAAARRVLESFDARSTRVGLVTFAGAPLPPPGAISIGHRGGPAAITEQALTADYGRVKKALDRVLARGPDGLTNMTEGVRTAVRELKGFRGGVSKPDPDSEKVVLFFTDGQPTLPYDGGAVAQNVRSVLRAADQAKRAGVTIHSFALGPEALAGPVAAVEMARITRGRFTPVRTPGDLVEIIQNVDFANLDSLTVRNATLDRPAIELVQKADGGFGALVPLAGGRNVIEVVARTNDGSEAREEVVVHHLAGASPGETPPELVALRNQVLERRVLSLKRGRFEAERSRNEELRREIELEIEEERTAAEARAQQQRRDLRIEPDASDAP
ncbi:MAG: VWA domain-containing protein, partial [Myxococcota bacterium]